MIAFSCTNCGRTLRANPEMAGKRTKCPGCATILTIPAAEAAAPAAKLAPKPAAAPTAPPAPATVPAGGVVTCECGSKIRTKPEWAGKTIKCPKCESRIKVPGAAAPAPAPTPAPAAPKPAPLKPVPPPPVDDNPFGDAGDSNFGGIGDDPFAGGEIPSTSPYSGGESFGDEGNSDEEAPVSKPARRAAPPVKKKGGGRALIYTLLLLLVASGGGFAAWAFYFNAAPTVIPGRPIAQGKNDDKDDDDKDPKTLEKVDAKEKPPVVDPVPEEKDPKEKDVPKVDEPKKEIGEVPAAEPSVFDLISGEAFGFASVKPQALFKTKFGQKLLAGLEEGPDGPDYLMFVEKFGVKVGDIDHVLMIFKSAPTPEEPNSAPVLFVVTTTKPIDNSGFKAAVDEKVFEKKMLADMQPYYLFDIKSPEKVAVVQIEKSIVVIGKEPDVVDLFAQFEKGPKAGPLTPLVKAAVGKTNLANIAFQLSKETATKTLEALPPPVQEMVAPVAEMQSGSISLTSDKVLRILVKLNFDDAAKADKVKDLVVGHVADALEKAGEAQKGLPPQFGQLFGLGETALKSITPRTVGSSLEIPVQVNSSLDELVTIIGPFLPMGGIDEKKELKVPEKTKLREDKEESRLEFNEPQRAFQTPVLENREVIAVDPIKID